MNHACSTHAITLEALWTVRQRRTLCQHQPECRMIPSCRDIALPITHYPFLKKKNSGCGPAVGRLCIRSMTRTAHENTSWNVHSDRCLLVKLLLQRTARTVSFLCQKDCVMCLRQTLVQCEMLLLPPTIWDLCPVLRPCGLAKLCANIGKCRPVHHTRWENQKQVQVCLMCPCYALFSGVIQSTRN